MARPKRYRHIRTDDLEIIKPTDSGSPYWPMSLRRLGHHTMIPKSRSDHWRQQAGWHTAGRPGRPNFISLPIPNGRKDPLSIMLVFDALMRVEPDSTIHANNLTRMLWDHYSHVAWDAVTVGAILNQLYEAFVDVGDGTEGDEQVLGKWRTSGLAQYAIIDTIPTRLWMGKVRDVAGDLAHRWSQSVFAGEPDLSLREQMTDEMGNVEWG